MLVKEVNDREGRLFGKFSGVGAKGTKLKETAWEEGTIFLSRKLEGFPGWPLTNIRIILKLKLS
jgi:hypothetical protein